MSKSYREVMISLASAFLGALFGAAGTFAVTIYQDHQAQVAAAPDLALSCNDTLSAWERASTNTLIIVRIDPSHYRPGRYNDSANTATFLGPHYPHNLPEYLKACTLRNDGDEVARRVTLQLYAMIEMLHDGRVASFAEVPITVGFDAVPAHAQGTFFIANMNPGEGNLGSVNSALYQTLYETQPQTHHVTMLSMSRYLHPMQGGCTPSVGRWPPIICLGP